MVSSRQVSVVIPCYNQGRFLGQAIESALRQEGCGRVEVVVVDDGSADATAEVAARYTGVKYIRQANAGLAAARNRGLAESGGEYVVFLDADDRLSPEALRVGVDALDSRPDLAFAFGFVTLIDADGAPILCPPSLKIQQDPYVELLRHNHIWSCGAVIYRRDIFGRVGRFNTAVSASADYDLNIRIASRFPILCHGQVVLEYRKHNDNMTRDFALMLKSAVTVRRSHARYVRRSSVHRIALETGIKAVQRDYGEKLVRSVRSQIQSREWARALPNILTLLQYYPTGLASLARRKLLYPTGGKDL
jgi:glycosyltransferase involved in cell wall biosynthesis